MKNLLLFVISTLRINGTFKKGCYERTNVFPDDDYNNNCTHLKTFHMSNRLPIASTYFQYPNENRYTWCSCNQKTKKVNEYVFTEKYEQQYVRECITKSSIDLDSDHLVLITALYTPMTRKACKR